ncbi:MAG TPA: EthD family reductase [Sneathiellales bacterium]|nr:EthD family reductase [Sneathiellales bacterium]
MIKLSFCLHRLPNLSHAEFSDYWLKQHGPLVRSHKDVLRIQRYVQTHGIDDDELNGPLSKSRGGAEAYDGVAELWWKSKEDIMEVVADPAGQEALQILLEDEAKFIDLPRSPLWMSEEHEIISLSD